MPKNDTQKRNKDLRPMLAASSIGITLIISMGIGALIGYYLDNKLNTSPWLLILFTAFGIAAGFKNIFIFVSRIEKQLQKEEKKERE